MKALKIIAAVLIGTLTTVLIVTFGAKSLKIATPTVSLKTATSIAGGIFLFILLILIIVVITRRRSYGSISGKVNYGKIIKWVIILSIIAALGLIAPKYIKKGWKEVTVSKSAFYSWKKLDHQYGYNPEQRSAGPLKTKVTKYDDKHLSFIVYDKSGNGYFDGWKIGKDKFKGKWRCPEANSGGEWILKKKSDDPETYVGVETDPSLPNLEDGKPSELIILD